MERAHVTLSLEIQDPFPLVTEADLLSVYDLYPRRGPGKQDGLRVLRKTVKTRADLDDCLRAVRAFVAAHQGQEKRFIRHFDRWARSWRDWLEVEDAPMCASERDFQQGRFGMALRVKATPPQAIDPISPEEARRFAAEQLERLKKGGA